YMLVHFIIFQLNSQEDSDSIKTFYETTENELSDYNIEDICMNKKKDETEENTSIHKINNINDQFKSSDKCSCGDSFINNIFILNNSFMCKYCINKNNNNNDKYSSNKSSNKNSNRSSNKNSNILYSDEENNTCDFNGCIHDKSRYYDSDTHKLSSLNILHSISDSVKNKRVRSRSMPNINEHFFYFLTDDILDEDINSDSTIDYMNEQKKETPKKETPKKETPKKENQKMENQKMENKNNEKKDEIVHGNEYEHEHEKKKKITKRIIKKKKQLYIFKCNYIYQTNEHLLYDFLFEKNSSNKKKLIRFFFNKHFYKNLCFSKTVEQEPTNLIKDVSNLTEKKKVINLCTHDKKDLLYVTKLDVNNKLDVSKNLYKTVSDEHIYGTFNNINSNNINNNNINNNNINNNNINNNNINNNNINNNNINNNNINNNNINNNNINNNNMISNNMNSNNSNKNDYNNIDRYKNNHNMIKKYNNNSNNTCIHEAYISNYEIEESVKQIIKKNNKKKVCNKKYINIDSEELSEGIYHNNSTTHYNNKNNENSIEKNIKKNIEKNIKKNIEKNSNNNSCKEYNDEKNVINNKNSCNNNKYANMFDIVIDDYILKIDVNLFFFDIYNNTLKKKNFRSNYYSNFLSKEENINLATSISTYPTNNDSLQFYEGSCKSSDIGNGSGCLIGERLENYDYDNNFLRSFNNDCNIISHSNDDVRNENFNLSNYNSNFNRSINLLNTKQTSKSYTSMNSKELSIKKKYQKKKFMNMFNKDIVSNSLYNFLNIDYILNNEKIKFIIPFYFKKEKVNIFKKKNLNITNFNFCNHVYFTFNLNEHMLNKKINYFKNLYEEFLNKEKHKYKKIMQLSNSPLSKHNSHVNDVKIISI
ncbi:OTU-like cysteine protease, partial [Hepatocystis sp. ex Piliocolobus tephrosceles]